VESLAARDASGGIRRSSAQVKPIVVVV
jgi:hypothetical protein